ncbi:MAG TPA: Na+/H+ antiporter [Candidatus Limnocylindrales bacterium]|nr:Na+/H+ antiporter [Candidatus Limnocylindrales bacterium]
MTSNAFPMRILGAVTGAPDTTAATTIEVVLVLLLAATGLAIVARRLAVPYPVLLVLGGLAIGFVPGLPPVELAPDIVFLLFLPPILFGAGYFTSIRDLKANLRPIGLLAVGLVLFTIVVVAVVVHAIVPGLGWAPAFALGAIVSPPDAVAATAIFQRLGVPRRMVTILEGESLLNDGTALVAYRLALAAAATGIFSLAEAGSTFVVASVGGIVVGIVLGGLAARLVRLVDDPVFSVILTFLAPLAIYLPAEHFGLSGVLATVTAGILVGRKAPRLMSSSVRVAGFAAWQVLLFLINGSVFILIGLQLPTVLARLGDRPPSALLGWAAAVAAAAIVARIVWVFPATYLPRALSRKIRERDPYPPLRNVGIVAWAGMRGVVSLAAALALPASFPERDLLIFLTFGVILATLVGQGLSLPLLIRHFGISDDAHAEGHEEAHARLIASESAVNRLEELAVEWPGHLELIDTLRAQYEHRTHHAELDHTDDEENDEAEQELIEHRQIRIAVIDAEREALVALRERGAVSDDVFRRVERDLDLEELRMEA